MTPKTTTPAPAFCIETAPLKWPVIVEVPADGGTFEKFQFTGIFARLTEAEMDELTGVAKKPAIETGAEALETAKGDEKRLAEVLQENSLKIPQFLIGWEGVKTHPGGADVPFSAETLAAQIVGPLGARLSRGIWNATFEIRNGVRLGNSEPLPAAGQKTEPAEAAAAE